MATHETPINKKKKLALTSAEANAEANIKIVAYYANQKSSLITIYLKRKN